MCVVFVIFVVVFVLCCIVGVYVYMCVLEFFW